MRPSGILLVVIFVCLAPGCGEDQDSSAPERAAERKVDQSLSGSAPAEMTERSGDAPATKIIVTSEDPSLPDGCSPRRAARLVSDFVGAFNQGDGAALSRIFFISEGPSPPDFSDASIYPWSWYSVSEIGNGGRIEAGFTTYDQRDLLRYFARRHDRVRLDPFRQLTARESEVLYDLMQGRNADAIAEASFVSVTTVRTHIRSILRKLDVSSQLAAVAMATGAGWKPLEGVAPGR
mgnify:CR=1 FL=1